MVSTAHITLAATPLSQGPWRVATLVPSGRVSASEPYNSAATSAVVSYAYSLSSVTRDVSGSRVVTQLSNSVWAVVGQPMVSSAWASKTPGGTGSNRVKPMPMAAGPSPSS